MEQLEKPKSYSIGGVDVEEQMNMMQSRSQVISHLLGFQLTDDFRFTKGALDRIYFHAHPPKRNRVPRRRPPL